MAYLRGAATDCFISSELRDAKIKVMGEYCYIRLDCGDEALFHYGEMIIKKMSSDDRLNLHLIAVRMANAANKQLRCFELPLPDSPKWTWDDIVNELTCHCLIKDIDSEVTVTGTLSGERKYVHFCAPSLLSGLNNDLWFPLSTDEEWITGIERILRINRLADQVHSLSVVRDNHKYTDWKVVFTCKAIQ